MPQIQARIISLRPIVAETGPIGASAPTTGLIPSIAGSVFVARHKDFTDQVTALDHCFSRGEIMRFTPEELEEHIHIALIDNFIIENGDTGIFCTGQVAWRLRELTKGYVYERL